jgi:hypothetical protein
VSTATFITGGVLLAAGATLVVLSLGTKKSVTVGLAGTGVALAGSFP